MNYYKYIYDIINPLVNGSVYPEDAYQETELPYVILQMDTLDPIDGKRNNADSDEVEFTVVILDKDVDTAQATAATIRNALDMICPFPIQSCRLESQTISFDSLNRSYTVFQNYYSRIKLITGPARNYSPLHYSPLHYST